MILSAIAADKKVGVASFIATAGVVSWATPDGNLVVTLVPALIVGIAAFAATRWRLRRTGRQ